MFNLVRLLFHTHFTIHIKFLFMGFMSVLCRLTKIWFHVHDIFMEPYRLHELFLIMTWHWRALVHCIMMRRNFDQILHYLTSCLVVLSMSITKFFVSDNWEWHYNFVVSTTFSFIPQSVRKWFDVVSSIAPITVVVVVSSNHNSSSQIMFVQIPHWLWLGLSRHWWKKACN